MISESECVHFYLSGRIDGCNENFNDIFYKSHVKRIASILWILLEAQKRRIYCVENISVIIFLLVVIIYVHINRRKTSLQFYQYTIRILNVWIHITKITQADIIYSWSSFFMISMRRTSICIEKNLISIFMRVRVFYFQFLSIELEWIATHLLKYTFRSIKCSKRKVSTKHIFSCPFIVRCNIW